MSTNNVQSIRIEYSDSAMWGYEKHEGYDVPASYAKFEEMVTDKLSQIYPDAEIEINNGIDDKYRVDGDTSSDDTEAVQNLVGKIWESFDWVVENAE